MNETLLTDSLISFFMKHVPSPVAMFDINMCYQFANDAWIKSFRLDKNKKIIGKSHYEMHPLQPKEWRDNHQRALYGEIVKSIPEKVINYFEQPIWLEGEIHPWYTTKGNIGGVIIYSNIVTNKIKLLEDLNQSNQALERFTHTCSHELKEPVRSISNFIHLLFSGNVEYFNEESLLYMHHALNGVDRIKILTRNLLQDLKI